MQEKHELVTAASPRAILRDAFTANILSQEEFGLLVECIRDRNLTSHTYNEPLAEEIVENVPGYYDTMKLIIERIKL